MTMPFTQADLDRFERRILRHTPPFPTVHDVGQASPVAALTAATTESGVLLKCKMQDGLTTVLFFNPVIAIQLMHGINFAARDGNWYSTPVEYQRDPALETPTPDEMLKAPEIISLTTASVAPMMLAHFALKGRQRKMMLLNKSLAGELFLIIQMSAKAVGWWDENFTYLPASEIPARH